MEVPQQILGAVEVWGQSPQKLEINMDVESTETQ